MKIYFVQILFDGDIGSSVMTDRELADVWEQDDYAGIGYEFAVFDIDKFGNPIRVNVEDIVLPIIENRRAMQREYDDYCEAVNEYGLDFEGRDQ